MNAYFQIRGWEKQWVEDRYDEGEVGPYSCFDGDTIFEAPTLKGVIEKALEFVGGTWLDIYVDEENPSRFAVSVMECDCGFKADPVELALWKKGKLRLWGAEYSFVVNHITEEQAVLTEEMMAGFSKEDK